MIPSWAAAALIGLGFGLFPLVGILLRYRRRSLRRLERVVTFTLMGVVFVVLGTAQVAAAAVEPADRDRAEAIVVTTVLACIPLSVAGLPAMHWWAARRYGRRPAGLTDFGEDRGGNAVRPPPDRGGYS